VLSSCDANGGTRADALVRFVPVRPSNACRVLASLTSQTQLMSRITTPAAPEIGFGAFYKEY
jgi:hypothetical protein